MKRLQFAALIANLWVVVIPSAAAGLPIVNGSLTGPRDEGQLPLGWVQYQGNSSDTADPTGPFGTYNLSPDSGTFVRSFSWQPDTDPFLFNQREGLEQSIAGFTIGQSYQVTFYQSSVNGINSITGLPFSGAAGFWTLAIDASVKDFSDLMSPPPGTSLDNRWTLQTLFFTATSSTHMLSFLATVPDSAPVRTRTFMAIDGISLIAVPEPGTAVLCGLGVFVLALRRGKGGRS